jgi:hypothetical protein
MKLLLLFKVETNNEVVTPIQRQVETNNETTLLIMKLLLLFKDK